MAIRLFCRGTSIAMFLVHALHIQKRDVMV